MKKKLQQNILLFNKRIVKVMIKKTLAAHLEGTHGSPVEKHCPTRFLSRTYLKNYAKSQTSNRQTRWQARKIIFTTFVTIMDRKASGPIILLTSEAIELMLLLLNRILTTLSNSSWRFHRVVIDVCSSIGLCLIVLYWEDFD